METPLCRLIQRVTRIDMAKACRKANLVARDRMQRRPGDWLTLAIAVAVFAGLALLSLVFA